MDAVVPVLLRTLITILFTISATCDDLGDCQGNSKCVLVGMVTGTMQNSSRRAFAFIQEYVNKKIMPNEWRMAFKFVPESDNDHLLSDVTGSGLYRITKSLDRYDVSVFIGPGSSTQTKIAVLDMLQFYGWNRVSLITTENDYGFGAESSLLKIATVRGCKVEVIARFKVLNNAEDIPISETLDRIQSREAHPIVLVTGSDYGKVITRAAYLRGMSVTRNWLWILMDGVAVDDVLNVSYVDKNGRTAHRVFNGLVGTRPVMSEGALTVPLTNFWAQTHAGEKYPWEGGFGFDMEKAFDAIISTAYGFQNYSKNVNLSFAVDIDGNMLRDAILRVNTDGMTTRISYDLEGKTQSTEYDLLLSSKGQWKGIGEWSDLTKLNMSYAFAMNYSKTLQRLTAPLALMGRLTTDKKQQKGRIVHAPSASGDERPIIHVVTILESPFVILGEGNHSSGQEELTNRVLSGDIPEGDRKPGMDVQLHGYCIDMLQKLSEHAGILYSLRLVEDSMYGGFDEETEKWNGMIGDVIKGRSHAAVAPITVTSQRAEYVDFSTSFIDISLKFIVDRRAAKKGSSKDESGAFAFLLPFHYNLYTAIGICVVYLAAFLSLISRLSPYGTRGHFFLGPRIDQFRRKVSLPQATRISTLSLQAAKETSDVKKLRTEKEDADRAMGFNNALYFVWASLFWQTPERVPRAPSARFVTAVWYLAAVVFVASYTANMVAFVSSQTQVVNKLDSISELVSQTRLQYGTVADSSVEYIFQSSGIKLATHIYDFLMSDSENLMVPTSAVGLERVRNGTYALLWDSLVLDFEASKSDCRLKTADVGFGGVVYALALPKHSSLTTIFSRHILKLKELGYMATLWKRYFVELEKCVNFGKGHEHDDMHVRRLTFGNLAGVFYLVAFAMGAGLVVLACEWISAGFFDVNRNDPREPQTLAEALRIRFQRLKQDVTENWLPHPVMDITTRWSSMELPASNLAMSILRQRLEKKTTLKATRAHRKSKVDKLRRYSSEMDLSTPSCTDAHEKSEKPARRRRFSLAGFSDTNPASSDDEARTPSRTRRLSLTESLAEFRARKSGQIFPIGLSR